jgi:hypothetical protein
MRAVPPRKGVRMLLGGLAAGLGAALWSPAPAPADPLIPPVEVALPPVEVPPVVSVSPTGGVQLELPPVLPGEPPQVSLPPPTLPGLNLPAPPTSVALPVSVPVGAPEPTLAGPDLSPGADGAEPRSATASQRESSPVSSANAAPNAAPNASRVPIESVDATPAAVTGRIEETPSSVWSTLGTAATSFGLWFLLVSLALVARFVVASLWRARRPAIR